MKLERIIIRFIILALFTLFGFAYFGSIWAQTVGPIEIENYSIDDDEDRWADDNSNGDGDGIAEQGETVRIPVTLINLGDAIAMDVKATLSTQSLKVKIIEAVKDYGVIAAGTPKFLDWRDGFHFVVSDTASSGEVHFRLNISTSNGDDFVDSLTVSIVGGLEVGPIIISSYVIDDDEDRWGDDNSNGDGDGIAEQGETVRLGVVLRNNGTASAVDVIATLSTESDLVKIIEAKKDYGVIENGKTKTLDWRDGFHFIVSDTAFSGEVHFSLNISTSNGGDFVYSLTVSIVGGLEVGPIIISSYVIDDDEDRWGDDNSNGDGDGIAEQGETVRLGVVLENIGTASAIDVVATLYTESYLVKIIEAKKNYGVIENRGSKTLDMRDGFHFVVSDTASTGKVKFQINITTGNNGEFVDSLTVSVLGGLVVGPLSISSYIIDDDDETWANDNSNGDGDGIVEEGETIRLGVVIGNAGDAGAMGVVATLTTESELVKITEATKDYGVIEAEGTKTMDWRDGFHFKVQETDSSGEVKFYISISTSNDGEFTDSLTVYIVGGLIVGPIEILNFSIDDDEDNWAKDKSKGDGNGIIGPWETVRLPITLINFGSGTATGIEAILETDNNSVTILDPKKEYGVLGAGEAKELDWRDGYHILISGTSAPQYVRFNLSIMSGTSQHFQDKFFLPIGKKADLNPPQITINHPRSGMRYPPSGFEMNISYADQTNGAGLDLGTFRIWNNRELSKGETNIAPFQNLKEYFYITSDSAIYVVSENLVFHFGMNSLTTVIEDTAGNMAYPVTCTFTIDKFGIMYPHYKQFVNKTPIEVNGFALSEWVSRVEIEGNIIPIINERFTANVNLTEGMNKIPAIAYDALGEVISSDTILVILDSFSPYVSFTSPLQGQVFQYSPITVKGKIYEDHLLSFSINGMKPQITNDDFEIDLDICEGNFEISLSAIDSAGNFASKSVSIIGNPPDSPAGNLKLYLKNHGELSKFPFPPYPQNTSGFEMTYVFESNTWKFPVHGNIKYGNLQISVLYGCYGVGNAIMKAEVFVHNSDGEFLVGSSSEFEGDTAGPTPWPWPLNYIKPPRGDFKIQWTNSNITACDTLLLKISKVGGDRTGLIFIRESSKGQSWLLIPELAVAVNEEHQAPIPNELILCQNYPNPFNSTTNIKYQLPRNCHVTLKIFNALGKEVATLVNEPQKAGYFSVSWDALGLASGVYFIVLKAEEYTTMRKILLIK